MRMALYDRYHHLFAAPLVLRPGDDIDSKDFLMQLAKLGYLEAKADPLQPGTYTCSATTLLIAPLMEKGRLNRLRIDLQEGIVQLISRQNDGALVSRLELERPLLTAFTDSLWEVRYPLSFAEIPESLKQAITATEDTGFFSHPGVDLRGIARAAFINLCHGRVVQGGSTITQQLVKSLLHRSEREFAAKLEEAVLALLVEMVYTKEEIFTAYCNTIYLGRIGPFAVHGMAAAARHLLGKEVQALTPGDCALLAGLIRSPNPLSPLRHPEAAISRAKVVLDRMGELGMLAEPASLPPLSTAAHDSDNALLARSWYYATIEKEVARALKKRPRSGQNFALALNLRLQETGQQALRDHLATLEKRSRLPEDNLQAALVAVDVETGGVRALIGGRNFTKNSFNRALYAERQIGSLVKPFVYLAAMESLLEDDHSLTPLHLMPVADSPLARTVGGKVWRPANFDHRYLGLMSWREALVTSRNIPAVRIGEQAGLQRVASLLRGLGISEVDAPSPALFLGAVESTPFKIAAAYRSLAAEGRYIRPFFLDQAAAEANQLVDPMPAAVITDMLQGVLTKGTGKGAARYGIQTPVAGKTGTSSDLRDGWFAGYSPRLAIAVWVGRDQSQPIGFTGAAAALPIWATLMKDFGGSDEDSFAIPDPLGFIESTGYSNEIAVSTAVAPPLPKGGNGGILPAPPRPGSAFRLSTKLPQRPLMVKKKEIPRYMTDESAQKQLVRNSGPQGSGTPLVHQQFRFFD
jgi:penicillin-binding protein 1B